MQRLWLPRGVARVKMRRSHRPSSTASSHNLTANFFSENSNSSHSATSEDSNGQGSPGPELGESEGRMSQGSSCGEPALSPGVLRGNTWAPRSHNGQTALCAATVRGGASGTGGVEPGGERAGRARGAGPCAEPTRRLRGSCLGGSREGVEEILCLGVAEEVSQGPREWQPGPRSTPARTQTGVVSTD